MSDEFLAVSQRIIDTVDARLADVEGKRYLGAAGEASYLIVKGDAHLRIAQTIEGDADDPDGGAARDEQYGSAARAFLGAQALTDERDALRVQCALKMLHLPRSAHRAHGPGRKGRVGAKVRDRAKEGGRSGGGEQAGVDCLMDSWKTTPPAVHGVRVTS